MQLLVVDRSISLSLSLSPRAQDWQKQKTKKNFCLSSRTRRSRSVCVCLLLLDTLLEWGILSRLIATDVTIDDLRERTCVPVALLPFNRIDDDLLPLAVFYNTRKQHTLTHCLAWRAHAHTRTHARTRPTERNDFQLNQEASSSRTKRPQQWRQYKEGPRSGRRMAHACVPGRENRRDKLRVFS